MDYKLVYTKSSQRDLARFDDHVAKRIVAKLDSYARLKDPMGKAVKLRGFGDNTYRFRVGEYRAIFRIDAKTKRIVLLVILRIAHRKSVYKA